MRDSHVVVVGGGLAGVSAALRLADAGTRVTLLEGRPRLGGAAFSFQRHGWSIDNGQHVFLRCCDSYRWFLDRIGASGDVVLQDRLDIPVLRPDGTQARLKRQRGVPAPAHLTAALARYTLLRPADRLRAVRGALALRRLDPTDTALDNQTLGTFLRAHGQNDATIGALWGVVATATLNLEPDEASLALAAKVFRTGLLDHAPAADVGYAAVPLGEIHSRAAAAALQSQGVEVLLGHRVDSVEPGAVVTYHGPDGASEVRAEAVVIAVPHQDAFAIAPALQTSTAAAASGLGHSPIVNIHLVYDRRVTGLTFAAAVESPVQWFFDRTETSGVARSNPGAQYLAVTVSAADGVIDAPSRVVRQRFVAELGRLLPRSRSAEVVDAFVTRERRATFRQCAGSASLRPGADTGLDGIWLAGAWTATGWPDTMEGAVRSGLCAADALLRSPLTDSRRSAA